MEDLSRKIVKASLVVFAVCFSCGLSSDAQTPAINPGRKPVLVELFTAEGCSSCPPAEAMALKMEKQPLAGVDLIVLEEHVDYWNQSGWIDPFSSMEWTDRQKEYVSKLANGNPYTPEMVVDGQAEFVGSNGQKAQSAIEKAVDGAETNVTVTDASLDSKGSGDFKISVGNLEGATPGDQAEVWLAVTEDGLHTSVTGGENAGHTLYHAAVLRSLRKIGVAEAKSGAESFAGDARVKIKSNWNHENVDVVAFVQERKSRRILGAASTKLGT